MSEPLCTVRGDEIEPGMWRLECGCGWTTLVPDVERVGATLSHLAGPEPEDPVVPGMVEVEPGQPLSAARVMLIIFAMLILAFTLWIFP